MFVAPSAALISGPEYSIQKVAEAEDVYHHGVERLTTGGTRINEIRVGDTVYRLRQSLRGTLVPDRGGTWMFWVEGMSPTFVGEGQDMVAAQEDWRNRVHGAFQDLYGRRPFELEEDEQCRWAILERVVDVVSYRNETPLTIREVGWVSRARPSPEQVTWADGRREPVSLEVAPAPFAAYKPGQWFEAVVARNQVTGGLLKILHAERIPSIHGLSREAEDVLWESFTDTSSLPESNREWTKPC